MRYKNTLVSPAEDAHHHALAASRRAIRAGDLVKAERWMRLAERHYRCGLLAERAAYDWRKWTSEREAWRKAQEERNRQQCEKMWAEDARRAARESEQQPDSPPPP
jgi:hypothetical protein